MNGRVDPFTAKFRRRKDGRSTEWHAWLYMTVGEKEVELVHLTATNKRDIQKAMGDKIADLGMRLSMLAPEARRDDICFIDGKMVTNDWVCDQRDWGESPFCLHPYISILFFLFVSIKYGLTYQ